MNRHDIVCKITREYATPFNFTKGVKVSPDGLCAIVSSEDNVLRLFELECSDSNEPKTSVLSAREGGCIYDFQWFPLMNSANPESCVFLTSSRDSPVHLWDAYCGQVRCVHSGHNHV